MLCFPIIPFLCRNSPSQVRAASFLKFRYHNQTHVTRTPLDEDRPVIWTSSWQHTTRTKERYLCLGVIRTRNPSIRTAADPLCRRQGHTNWRFPVMFSENIWYQWSTYSVTHGIQSSFRQLFSNIDPTSFWKTNILLSYFRVHVFKVFGQQYGYFN